ncbi:hypothetical protein [Geodermatophilus obscurus]|uniref:hypothetical protein n=1 Tax=Geodermatophilus obscurus TaxID=1861 RepID=UPI000A745527|nr:hypothetical protein [Geodermatophilus obscurus]
MAEQQVRGTDAGTVRTAVRTAVGTTPERRTTRSRTTTVTTPVPTAGEDAGQGSGTDRRCGWCRRVLPQAGSVGRPRLYCGQACRQRAYEQRSATAKAGLSDDVVLVRRAELDGLQDRLFQLRCALEDVQTLLGERHTKAELERSLADLVHSTGRLDRLWVTERAG